MEYFFGNACVRFDAKLGLLQCFYEIGEQTIDNFIVGNNGDFSVDMVFFTIYLTIFCRIHFITGRSSKTIIS